MNKNISIIIPNYNGLHYLKVILPKLEASPYEIIVVDNGSTDGSNTYLTAKAPRVRGILNGENKGFSGAVNQGILAATASYVLLLNNDTDFNFQVFDRLRKTLDEDKTIFSVAAKMVQYHKKNLIDTAGDEYNALGWAHKRGYNKSVKTRTVKKRVFSACAGAAIYRKSVFEKIGLFDEAFFAYMEDVDIGFRANLYGYKNIYCPDAVVYHVGSGTSGTGRNSFKARLSGRNNIYVAYKNSSWLQLIFHLPFLTLGFFIKALFFAKNGLGKAYISGVWEGLTTLKRVKRVPRSKKKLKACLWVEKKLWMNTLGFVFNRFF